MTIPNHSTIEIPSAPRSITKGTALKDILNDNAIGYMARNIELVYPQFDSSAFYQMASDELDDLSLMQRGKHIARALHKTLPETYSDAINVIIKSMTLPSSDSEEFGLASMFYLPYSAFIAQYGLDSNYNNGADPFDTSMRAQVELTLRFTAEFSIRPFIIAEQERALKTIKSWLCHDSNHVRRLCSEGTRPKLPWGINIPAFIKDPSPVIPILEALKNDESLYVRRSVANNLGDIAKNHPELVFDLCESWLKRADKKLKWVIRHALRYPAKKKVERALELRLRAK